MIAPKKQTPSIRTQAAGNFRLPSRSLHETLADQAYAHAGSEGHETHAYGSSQS